MTSTAAQSDERRARAAARLTGAAPDAWYFAVIGLAAEVEEFKFDVAARLVPVADAPTEAELAAALHDPRLFAAIGRWIPAVRHELVIDRRNGPTPKPAIDLASLIVTALRIVAAADVLTPAFADHSWSTLAAIVDGRCTAALLGDAAHARGSMQGVGVSAAHLEWVWPHVPVIGALQGNPRFRLAVDALASHRRDGNPRLAAVTLWAGVDTLCPVEGVWLAAALAALLEPPGAARVDVHGRCLALVAARPQLVGCELLTAEDVQAHVREARALLARLLRVVVEARRVPDVAEVRRRALSSSW